VCVCVCVYIYIYIYKGSRDSVGHQITHFVGKSRLHTLKKLHYILKKFHYTMKKLYILKKLHYMRSVHLDGGDWPGFEHGIS
jgi:hypothetical protein